ncbi:PhoPQ-activated protein PqaA family protein, partial [Sinorhizobium meliloti]|nr:PhoPQ-activated pathogenicity-related family protein [Sinorhizobium meliloti]
MTTIPGDGYTAHVLDMTSQQWRSAREVDKPLWRHW